jgi:AbrB family looped-hinge helix DNA binding protein
MASVIVSPKFQVTIPRAARESLHIRPGQKLEVIANNGQLRFIPIKPWSDQKGVYRGVGSKVERDHDRV